MRTLFVPLALSAILVGCSSEPTCDYSKEPYMAAREAPLLRAPEGLSTPDRSAALVVPPAAAGAPPMPTGAKTRCLDRPPSYFKTTPAAPPAKDADVH